MLKHVFINLNACCIQWYKFHVHRGKGSGDTVTQIYPFAPKSLNMVGIHGLTAPNLKGMSPHHVRIFRKYRNRSLTWCNQVLIAPCVHELQVLESRQLQSRASSWTRLSHMTTAAAPAVSTAVWTLDHLKYTYLEG